MRQIPSEVLTLLKSRSMIGENKPSYEVTVENLGGSRELQSTVKTLQGYESTIKLISNWVPTNNGKYMCCWFDSSTKQLQTGFSADRDFLDTDYAIESIAVTSGISVVNVTICQTALYKRADGKVLLFVGNYASTSWTKCYISETGNGDDWVYLSTVQETTNQNFSGGIPHINIPVRTSTGRLVMCFFNGSVYSTQIVNAGYVAVSDDDAVTWTIKKIENKPAYGIVGVGQPCYIPDSGLFYCETTGSGNSIIFKSNDDGNTWINVANFADSFSDALVSNVWFLSFFYDSLSGYVYAMAASSGIYLLDSANSTDFIDKTKWKYVYDINQNNQTSVKIYTINNDLIFHHTSVSWILWYSLNQCTLPVKSINISRNKNMAGSLNITIDNKEGIWSPDGTEHPNAIWPNNSINVKQGYGTNLVQTFTALIDRIEMTTFPAELKVSNRDKLKLALDQTITSGTSHVITYTGQTVEFIFTDLAGKAGLTTGTIETTGLTLAEKTFSWETYADCFQWLADLVGFEYGSDEDGNVYFKKDAIPAAEDWILTFTSGTAQAYAPIIANSETLKTSDGFTTYARDTDYTIDYETGEIISITIPDGQTLMSYIFAAYTFREGVDIISLGYTIDDNDIYSKVIVFGKDANDAVISAYKDYVSKDYYKVLSQKIMRIDVSEATTVEQLQAIADKAEMLMRSRVREVNFAAIAVPWLQVGDLIKVVERSTTISEIYRITDLSTSYDNNGYTMQITCYHHSI